MAEPAMKIETAIPSVSMLPLPSASETVPLASEMYLTGYGCGITST